MIQSIREVPCDHSSGIQVISINIVLISTFDPSLSVSNYIQDIIITPAQHEPLRQELTPDAIVNAVHHWMNYYWKDDITRCDRNARACWATICGGLHRDWVFCGTESLTAVGPFFSCFFEQFL